MLSSNRSFLFVLFFLVLSGCSGDGDLESSSISRVSQAVLNCGEDADGDGIENCTEQNDGSDWTDPEIFNGMRVSHADRCHYKPSCDRIDDLFEVRACSKVDEEKLLYSGWDFSTTDTDLCDPGYGFEPAWDHCSQGFQIEASGYIALTESGYHCFAVLGADEFQEQCGSFFFHDQIKAVVTNQNAACFHTSSGIYPIRWFYESSGRDAINAFHVSYCSGGDSRCTPSEAIPSRLLRPVYYQCIPTTCALQKAECGEIDDGCGSVLDCDRQTGGCTGNQSCGGGGEPNQCGCAGERCCQQDSNSDGDGIDDCDEISYHDRWTDPAVFNGMRVSFSDACHQEPSCDKLDTLDEVEACEKSDEELLQYSGWDFTTAEPDLCESGYGFRPGWTDCEDEFQIDATGFIKLDNNGHHCFAVASESDNPGQCAVLFFDDQTDGITSGQEACFDYSAGIYPIRWFYEANHRATTRSMRVSYCYGDDDACSPTDTLDSSLVRPIYTGDEAICLEEPILCTALCPCDAGQGPCSDDSHCRGDLVCGEGNGQRYGAGDEDNYCWSEQCESDPVETGCGSPDEPCGYCPENCINGIDDDQDGYIDCDDTECMPQVYCEPEDCHNGIDDNLNGLLDCADPDCYEDLECHCGNGIRQAHSRIVPREGCDDGNTEDGDACSSSCEPTVMVVRSEDVALKAPNTVPARAGVSGNGNILMLWLEDEDDHWEIRAERYNHGGAIIDDESGPLIIDDTIGTGWPAEATVAGLPESGWVVVWTSQSVDGDGAGIAYRIVDGDGTFSSVMRANQQRNFGQSSARVAMTEEGFVITWVDEGSGSDRTLVKARLFSSAGQPLGDEFTVGTANIGDESQPEIAANGNHWMVVWTNAEDRSVRARRYEGDSALDISEMVLSHDSHSASVTAMPESGDFALSWTGVYEGEPGPEDDMAFATYSQLLNAGETVDSDSGERVLEVSDGTPEYYSSVAALNQDVYLVAWQYGPVYRDSDFAIIDNSNGRWPGVPIEESALREALTAESNQRELEVTPMGDGVWFTWTFDGLGSAGGISNALMAYLLPGD